MKTAMINAHIVTMDPNGTVIGDGFILYENDTITHIGSMESYPDLAVDQTINAKNMMVIPGMINAHTHLGMMSFRSLADDVVDRLRLFLFPLEKDYMTPQLAYASARYACAEMLLSGITTCVDMYYFEDIIAQAVETMGMRAYLGETIIDQATCDARDYHEGLKHAEAFLAKWQGHDLITPIIAPHAPNTNTTAGLKKAHALAEKYDTLLMMHVAEMEYEMDYFQTTYQCTPVEYLQKIGLCDARLLAVHALYVNNRDRAILKAGDARIIHCPGANTKSGKGIAPIKEAREQGISFALGTDGPSSGNTLDMFTQMKLFSSIHKTRSRQRDLFLAAEIASYVTSQAAHVLHAEQVIGSLETGKRADIVCLDKEHITMFPFFDPYSVWVYSAQSASVSKVIVNGELLVDDKKLLRHCLNELRSELEQAMTGFSESAHQRLKSVQDSHS